jgi:hypothetical protein
LEGRGKSKRKRKANAEALMAQRREDFTAELPKVSGVLRVWKQDALSSQVAGNLIKYNLVGAP